MNMTRVWVLQNLRRMENAQIIEAINTALLKVEELDKFYPDLDADRKAYICQNIESPELLHAWEEAQAENSIAAYRAFVLQWQEGAKVEQAKQLISQLLTAEAQQAWQTASQENSIAAYRSFIEQYGESDYANVAHNKLQQLRAEEATAAWNAIDQNNIEALEAFVSQYPEAPQIDLARALIATFIEVREQEDAAWNNCLNNGRWQDYDSYLRDYPDGRYAHHAQAYIESLEEAQNSLKNEAFSFMRRCPELIGREMLYDMLSGRSVDFSSFLGADYAELYFTEDELIKEGLISRTALEYVKAGIAFNNPKLVSFDDLPTLPDSHTDVYFFGVPGSGKSTVLSSFLSFGHNQAATLYQPLLKDGIDPCRQYYDDLVACMSYEQLPPRTERDFCNTIGLRLISRDRKRYSPLNFIELGGEYFLRMTETLMKGDPNSLVSNHAVTRFLTNKNRKVLFFLIDYSIISNRGTMSKLEEQRVALQRALDVFQYGAAGIPSVFEMTDSICVIVSKADQMGVSNPDERYRIAREYLENNHRNFMESLSMICRQYGINRTANFSPRVMTYSVGDVGIGDTVSVNYQDASILMQLISENSRSYKLQPSWWDNLKDALR